MQKKNSDSKFFNVNTKFANCDQFFAIAVSQGKGLLATCRGEEGEADIAGLGRGGSPQGGVRARGRPREGGPRLQQVLSGFSAIISFDPNKVVFPIEEIRVYYTGFKLLQKMYCNEQKSCQEC